VACRGRPWKKTNKQITGQGIVGMLAGYEENLKKKERCLCRQISVLVYSKSSSGNRAWPLLLLNTGDDDPDDPHAVQKEVSLFKLSFVFVNFYEYEPISFLGQTRLSGTTLPVLYSIYGKVCLDLNHLE
jgi:hypothetical protein